MAFDLKKMSLGQLIAIAGGLFLVVMVIAGFIISSTNKSSAKVVTKRPAQFETPVSDVAMDQLRAEINQLKQRMEQNAQAQQAAFTQTAAAVDKQNTNIAMLDNNMQVTTNRVQNLERQRIGARVNIVKPEDQVTRPTRSERLAAIERSEQSGAVRAVKPMRMSNDGDYKVLASVGDRAWIRNGDEEISVREGESIPLSGRLVVKRISSNGQVAVDVESSR